MEQQAQQNMDQYKLPQPKNYGKIREFRVVLPMQTEEYHVAQLYSVAEASKNETGGGEGIEVWKNEPFNEHKNAPDWPLMGGKYTEGQYTHKVYKLDSKVPTLVRYLAPKGSLEFHERAWNAYPYCRTVVSNPGYMKEAFYITIESLHLPDRGDTHNAHELDKKRLADRRVINLDIRKEEHLKREDLAENDPNKFTSKLPNRAGYGPLRDEQWQKKANPVMCCYKLVTVYFKWFGLQDKVEGFIQNQYPRLFTKFHRELYCQVDKWDGLTIEDIRKIEEETKQELDRLIHQGEVRGTKAD